MRIENSVSAGMPDVIVLHGGQVVWIELKVGKPLLRAFQYTMQRRMLEQGIRPWVLMLDKVEDVIRGWQMPFEVEPSGVYHRISSPPSISVKRLMFEFDLLSSSL